MILTYLQAEQLYKKARSRNGYKLANNTYLCKVYNNYGIRLHNTIIIEITPRDTYILKTGGWRTSTTKSRLNTFSPASIYQDAGKWYYGKFDARGFKKIKPFMEGLEVERNGDYISPKTALDYILESI